MLKFTINVHLGKLQPDQKRVAIKELEDLLKINNRRFYVIRNAKLDSNVHLKDWQLKIVADYFQIPMENVLTEPKLFHSKIIEL